MSSTTRPSRGTWRDEPASSAQRRAPAPKRSSRIPNVGGPAAEACSAMYGSPTEQRSGEGEVEGGGQQHEGAHRRIAPCVGEAGADLWPSTPRRGPSRRLRGAADGRPSTKRERDGGDRERDGIEDEGGAGVGSAAITSPARAGPMSPANCWLPCIRALAGGSSRLVDQHRHDGAERRDRRGHRPRRRCRPSRRAATAAPAGQHQEGHDPDQHGPNGVRIEHQAARRPSVGERATEQHEDGPRDGGRHQHAAERDAGAGQLQRQPGERDEVELVAEDRDALAGEEEAEVGDAEAAQEWLARPVLGRGDGRASAPSAAVIRYVMRTPSPSSSSATSTIGPIVSVSTACSMSAA